MFYQTYLADNPNLQIDTKPGSSILIDKAKTEKIEFNNLIKSHSGKVVYVDLWASWCMPCRASMPDSRKLVRSFSGKSVAFIYLSIDEKFSDWEKASKEEGLSLDKNSFLLVNFKESAILKELGMKTIPRYLLFDKRGKLVHQNAPGPGSDELIRMIDKYLLLK